MLLSCLSRSTSLPSAIIARGGYVWLPIGRPSGFADAVPALASMNPAAGAPAPVFPKNPPLLLPSPPPPPARGFPKNPRLVIPSIVPSPDCQLNCEISTAPSAFRLKPEATNDEGVA